MSRNKTVLQDEKKVSVPLNDAAYKRLAEYAASKKWPLGRAAADLIEYAFSAKDSRSGSGAKQKGE